MKIQKILEITTVVVAVLLIVTAALIYLSGRLGFRVDAVISDSMKPTLSVGTMVISSVVPSEELEVGDVIVFRPVSVGEKPIVHRIIEVRNTYPLTFKTQGDAYPEPDQWFVPEDNIIGKLEFSSPFLGYITNFFRSKIGLVITLVLPAVVLVLMILRYIWRELVKYIRNKPMSAS